MTELKNITDKLNDILSQNKLKLINEFEEEFIKLEYEKETSSMIICGNRQLIRNAFYLIVVLYEEKATLYDFQTLINNYDGQGEKMVKTFAKKETSNFNIQAENDRIVEWFLNDYFNGLKGYIFSNITPTYIYCLPTRYLIDKMIDTIKISNNIYDNNEDYNKPCYKNALTDKDVAYLWP